MLQCNTSGEENKGGFLEEEELFRAAEFVKNESNFMKLEGLMTIGSVENSKRAAEENIPNADFTRLHELRQKGIKKNFLRKLELFSCRKIENFTR